MFAKKKILKVAQGALAKHIRKEAFKEIWTELKESFGEEVEPATLAMAKNYFQKTEKAPKQPKTKKRLVKNNRELLKETLWGGVGAHPRPTAAQIMSQIWSAKGQGPSERESPVAPLSLIYYFLLAFFVNFNLIFNLSVK